MKVNKKLYSLASVSSALILFLILVSSTASALTSQDLKNVTFSNVNASIITDPNVTSASTSAVPKIIETRITTHGTASCPDIYGNILVWQDKRNGNYDIYIYDISTHKEIHTTNKSNQTNPAVYGNIVVWADDRNGGSDIYMQDLSTKVQTRITKSGKAYNPVIYGDKIVWTDGRNGGSFNEWGRPVGNYDIYMYDLFTRKETQITTDASMQADPHIYGSRIIWEDGRNGYSYIGLYNLSTHKEKLLDFEYTFDPAIYGSRVVYVTDADNIAMYDLSTDTWTHILPSDISTEPAIYAEKVIYTYVDRITEESEIRMYDISTKTDTQISTSKSASSPKINGNRIVWVDGRNSGSDIYMGTLIYSPLAKFSASPTTGKHPLNVKFTDKSTGSPTSWSWNFGDKSTSAVRSSAQVY